MQLAGGTRHANLADQPGSPGNCESERRAMVRLMSAHLPADGLKLLLVTQDCLIGGQQHFEFGMLLEFFLSVEEELMISKYLPIFSRAAVLDHILQGARKPSASNLFAGCHVLPYIQRCHAMLGRIICQNKARPLKCLQLLCRSSCPTRF